MSDRELKRVVVVGGGVYGPGYINPPPADVAERITSPGCWEGEPMSADPAGPALLPTKPADESPTPVDDLAPVSGPDEEPTGGPVEPVAEPAAAPAPAAQEQPPAPPKFGPGSGVTAWRAYAESRNVSYEAGASRDEIIEACEQAGVA